MSFTAVLDKIKTTFEADTDLQAWIAAQSSDALTVKTTYKDREEIAVDELPLVMLSRPSVGHGRNYGSLTGKHTVRIYAGFFQPDVDLRVNQLIEFGEQLLAVLEKDPTLEDLVEGITPGDSLNDEGATDTCFLVQEITVAKKGV